jgi:cytolethal distending toxin subunit B
MRRRCAMYTVGCGRLSGWWRGLARIAAVVMLVVGGLVAVSAPAAAANLDQHNPVTYNMQGSSSDTTPKWSSDIPQLLGNHDVIALQEAGPLPPQDPNGVFSYQGSSSSNGLTVYHYLRNFGTSTRPIFRHVYFMETDPNGHRVNLAMVTTAAADELWFTGSTFTTSRPSFGVQLGNTVFYTIHGLSGGGNDVPGMLNSIGTAVQNAGLDYAIMGDFNRDPSTMTNRLPPNGHIYRSGRATQQSGGELDYMVASRDMGALGLLYQGHRIGGISADHYPVDFGVVPLRAAAGFSIGSYSNHGDQERIVDIYRGDSGNGTHVITYDPNGGGNQAFTFAPTPDGHYTIRNISTGKCLDLNKGPNAGNGDYVNEWDCQGQYTQEWDFGIWRPDGGALGIYNIKTNDCLDVLGNKTGNGVWVGIWPCAGTDNQKWTLEYLGYSLSPYALQQRSTTPRILTSTR